MNRMPVLVVGFVYLYCFPYFAALKHANELPRILTTEQIVERATFRLDDRMQDLGSLADISTTPDGRRYQNKAPGLSLAGVLVYYPLALAYRPSGQRPPLMLVTWLLRVTFAVAPTLGLLLAFKRVAARFATAAGARNAALVAFALGSMALPLALLFMSHAMAMSLVGIAFATAVAAVRGRALPDTRAGLTVGALLGLSILCEYQSIFAAFIVGGYLVSGVERRGATATALAAAVVPFVAVLAAYHWSAFGSPFRTGYAYSVDPANRLGVMGIVGVSKRSLSQLFIDPDNGLLLLSPWVVLAIAGAVSIARDTGLRARVGREALAASLVVVVYCAFVAALHPSFGRGGWEVGPRYIAIAMPFFAWLAAAGLDEWLRHRALRVVAWGLILVGVAIHVIAATTYPHWPVELRNPLFEISVRLLRAGYAPHSLGTWIGLRGAWSLIPLYATVAGLVFVALSASRRDVADVALAALLAGLVVFGYGKFPATPEPDRTAIWQFVTRTYEP